MTLPDFLVIGAAKAGTTALYWYLGEHPEIFMSPLKETNFFAFGTDESGRPLYGDPDLHRFPIRTLEEYQALFAEAGDARAVGEASPIYLECPQAAERIRHRIPEARLVCGLRDPVDRAYSDFLMYLRSRGRRLDTRRDLAPAAPWLQPDSHWVRIGRYHEALARYYERFPRERIHVFLFDDFKRSSEEVVGEIYRFLGVDTSFRADLAVAHNVGGVPGIMPLERVLTSRSLRARIEPRVPAWVGRWARRLRAWNLDRPPALPREVRLRLRDTFREDIERTAALVRRDLGSWLADP